MHVSVSHVRAMYARAVHLWLRRINARHEKGIYVTAMHVGQCIYG
jgi:hypothetical protein